MRFRKKITAVVLAAVVALSGNIPAVSVKAADWTQSGAYGAKVSYQTPESKSEAALRWSYRPKEGYYAESVPVIAGNYIYAADDNSGYLVKLTKDGKRVNEDKGKLKDSLYWVVNICYGDGKIFVPLSDGRVQAFDADTLESLWITEAASNAVTSKLTYHDGYLYGGTQKNGDVSGAYYAWKTEDENQDSSEEVKKAAWSYTDGNPSYYCSQGTVIGKHMVVADETGKLTALDLKTGAKTDEKVLDSGVKSGITYDKDSGSFYLISNATVVYRYRISEEGMLQELTHSKPLSAGGYSAGTPTICNGRLYVGGRDGAYGAKGFLAVTDASTLKLEYKAEAAADVQCQPLVTTAYSKSENQNKVIVYITANDNPGAIYYMTDSQTAQNGTVKELYVPEKSGQNYCMSDVIADEDGTLYYKNDSNYIFAVKKQAAQTKPDTKPQPEAAKPITYHKSSKRKIKVIWKKKTGAKGYVIYAKAGKGKYRKIRTVKKVTAKTVVLKSGYRYKFKVRPFKYKKSGKKTVRAYYKSMYAKGKEIQKTVTAVYGNVKGYHGYAIYMKTGKGSYRKVKDTTKGGTVSYVNQKAKVGKTYTFCLKGYKIIKGKRVYTVLKTKRI